MARPGFFKFLIIILCIWVSSAVAAEQNTTTVYSLGEVVVSENAVGSDINTYVEIDSTDIEQKNIKTLDQALELLPGMDVSKGTAGIPRVNIRGLRSRHTILLVNGIPVNSTWDQQFDPHLISAENISKIKVSYGTHSALYGQGGLAGVINIITKKGTDGLNMDASTQVNGRGNSYSKASVSGGQDKFHFFTSVSNSNAKGFALSDDFSENTFENGGIRENSDDERLSFFGNLAYDVNDALELGLTVERSEGEFGIPPVSNDDNTDPFYKNPKYDRVEDFKNFSSQFSFDYKSGGMFGIRGWTFVNTHEQRYTRWDNADYNTMNRRNSYIDDTETNVKGLTVQTSFNFETAGNAVISFSGQKDEFTSDYYIVEAHNTAPVYYHSNHELKLYTTAFEYRISPIKKLELVAGFSQHWQKKEAGDDDDQFAYMAGASFDVTDSTTIRASYAHKIRFPSIRQLYDSTSGDATLKPEESNNYEAGINQKLPWGMTADLSVFLSDVENYIEKDDVTDLFANNEEYRFKGFEVRLTKAIMKNGKVGISYSFLDTEDKSAGTQKDELQYRPEHKVVIDAGYAFDFGLTASADYTYIGEQYFYNNAFDKGTLSDYAIVNFKLDQKLYKENLSVYMGVDNLFDEDYEESYGFPQPGRTAYAGLKVKF